MNNLKELCNVSCQLNKVCDKICSLTAGINDVGKNSEEIVEMYESFVLDEIKHAQILTLEMTKLVTEQEKMDEGSAFAEGELTSVAGEKEPNSSEPL